MNPELFENKIEKNWLTKLSPFIDSVEFDNIIEGKNLNISDVIESKKSGGKEITAEKWMEDFMRHTGLTKEDALKKLKEFAEELKKTQHNGCK
jgi:hypothetical protein